MNALYTWIYWNELLFLCIFLFSLFISFCMLTHLFLILCNLCNLVNKCIWCWKTVCKIRILYNKNHSCIFLKLFHSTTHIKPVTHWPMKIQTFVLAVLLCKMFIKDKPYVFVRNPLHTSFVVILLIKDQNINMCNIYFVTVAYVFYQ